MFVNMHDVSSNSSNLNQELYPKNDRPMSHELKLGLVFRSFFQETFVAPTQENSLERIARTKGSKFISKSMGKENNDVHCWTFSIKNLLTAIYTEIIYKREFKERKIFIRSFRSISLFLQRKETKKKCVQQQNRLINAYKVRPLLTKLVHEKAIALQSWKLGWKICIVRSGEAWHLDKRRGLGNAWVNNRGQRRGSQSLMTMTIERKDSCN